MRALRETDIVKACLDYLNAKRVLCWRANSGAVMGEYRGKKRFVRFNSMPGMSDICGVLEDGRFLAVECKMPKKRATDEQAEFLRQVNKREGLGIVVHSVDDLAAQLRGFV